MVWQRLPVGVPRLFELIDERAQVRGRPPSHQRLTAEAHERVEATRAMERCEPVGEAARFASANDHPARDRCQRMRRQQGGDARALVGISNNGFGRGPGGDFRSTPGWCAPPARRFATASGSRTDATAFQRPVSVTRA